jgi:hypothetical protein
MADINKASLDPQQLLDDKVRRSGVVRAAALLHAACDAAGWLCWQLPPVLQPAPCRILYLLSVSGCHRLDQGGCSLGAQHRLAVSGGMLNTESSSHAGSQMAAAQQQALWREAALRLHADAEGGDAARACPQNHPGERCQQAGQRRMQ